MPTQVTSVANFHHLESLLLLIFLQRVDIRGSLGEASRRGRGKAFSTLFSCGLEVRPC